MKKIDIESLINKINLVQVNQPNKTTHVNTKEKNGKMYLKKVQI